MLMYPCFAKSMIILCVRDSLNKVTISDYSVIGNLHDHHFDHQMYYYMRICVREKLIYYLLYILYIFCARFSRDFLTFLTP